ncbi:hypothetical protein C8F01DRAFT_10688 [Mycena amicta]|nr:hypothetical protein C8F01DRAFT_10688 [Mycena amicta]
MADERDERNELLFTDEDGIPTAFFFHKSIRLIGARQALQNKIEEHGGMVVETDVEANIILVDTNHPSGNRDALRRAYKTHSNPQLNGVHVEAMAWVKQSIQTGKCRHPFDQKGMGGVPVAGRVKAMFTDEDEDHLVHYLGVLIPDKSSGGRLGKNVYKQLMENAEILPEEYAWAKRHTWQSWRERYKKNQHKFDTRIEEERPHEGTAEHQRYELSRKAPRSGPRIQYNRESNSPESEEWDELDDEIEQGPQTNPQEEEEESDGERDDNGGTANLKRRISEPESAQPIAKRRRTGARPSVKGKEKALPQSDDDEEEAGLGEHDPLFSDAVVSTPFRNSQATTMVPELVLNSPSVGVDPPRQPSPSPAPRQPSSKARSGARPIATRTVTKQVPKEIPVPPKEVVDTPARHTRSRSRSVGPVVVDVPVRKERKGRKGNKAKALEAVEEVPDDDPVPNEEQGPVQSETQMEEENVQELLAELSGISEEGVPAQDQEEDEQEMMPPPPPPRMMPRRRGSLDTDDGQTDAALRPRAVAYPRQPARDVLSRLRGVRLGSVQPEDVSKSPLIYRRSNEQQNISPDDVFSVGNSHSRRGSAQVSDLHSLLRSPGRSTVATVRSRGASESSAESFPLAGTRAKSVKRELRQQEKKSPYHPPPGTRAAAEKRG